MSKWTEPHKLRRMAGRARLESKAWYFVFCHPQEISRLPRWIHERSDATIPLRIPWWPYSAIEWLSSALPNKARVFEYGSGGSTLWLEDHGATVTVVEHDEQWHGQLSGKLGPRTRLIFQHATPTGTITSETIPGYFDDYVAAIDGEPDGSLDLVIIDGHARIECVRRALPKVKPGGLLLLDDTDRARYQPPVEMFSGWQRHVFTGLKPGQIFPAQTSAWRRSFR